MLKTVARVTATLLVAAAGCLGAYELWNYYMLSPWTRDATVRADMVTIAPDVAGFVNDLRVKDNQFVHKGDVLLVLDRERYSRALAMAEANVAARKAEMDMRQHEAARRAKLTSLMRSEQTRSASFGLPMQLGRRSWCRCAMVACGNPLSPSTVALQPSWQPIWPIRPVSGIHVQGAATAIR